MKKNSPQTQFVAHSLLKIAETGIKNNLIKRHVISDSDCKPLRSKGTSLGLSFFTSLFVAYFCVCVLCLVILILENVFKPNKLKMGQKTKVLTDQLRDKIDEFMQNVHKSRNIQVSFEERREIILILEKLHALQQVLHSNLK